MASSAFDGFIPLDHHSKDGKGHLVGNPSTGDQARARWVSNLWSYDIPGDVEQLDFEPTHYRPIITA